MIAVIISLCLMLGLQILTGAWWWVMAVAFLYGLTFAGSGWRAIRDGFLSAGLLWLGSAVFFYFAGSALIARRMAGMFGLGLGWLMIIVTALVAGVAAAFAGYAGYAVKGLFKKKPRLP
ncbi:MAG: hypothetical protein OEW05_02880 [Candidatus Aminicenantes bacterium]|nr:hypothetical protein [Candidatus Aminicenantes bacterium]